MNFEASIFIHTLSAIVWAGGVIFLAVVMVPLSRQLQDPPGIGIRILQSTARRFRLVAWVSLLILIVSGIWVLEERGISFPDVFTRDGPFFDALRIKVVLVIVVIVLSVLHDFILGPRLARKLEATNLSIETATAVQRQRVAVSWLARLNLLLALAIVAFGTILS